MTYREGQGDARTLLYLLNLFLDSKRAVAPLFEVDLLYFATMYFGYDLGYAKFKGISNLKFNIFALGNGNLIC